ncbi:hypothetical protein [Gloeobacter morelensis]|uniref:hypothetical protein n=1 Tax=Gloeobacter morelensis TaxID=2907343 RepID=UPI001E441899|nr:hypothetical protein [Gloeobacter morelensis]UFP97159.1 hypothetical protein ISF26_23855 [Gloeobacter morelensis MG652769]
MTRPKSDKDGPKAKTITAAATVAEFLGCTVPTGCSSREAAEAISKHFGGLERRTLELGQRVAFLEALVTQLHQTNDRNEQVEILARQVTLLKAGARAACRQRDLALAELASLKAQVESGFALKAGAAA